MLYRMRQSLAICSNNFVLIFAFCRHQAAIEEICRCASRELELEAKMRSTEEEWTEQVPYLLLTYI